MNTNVRKVHIITVICGIIIFVIPTLMVTILDEPNVEVTGTICIAQALAIIGLIIGIVTFIKKPDYKKSKKLLILTIILGIVVFLTAAYSFVTWQS